VEIVELSADEVRAAADELGGRLLDAAATGAAPGWVALLEAAIERAHELGLRVLWLSTHVETDSDRFYSLAGSAFYYRVL